MSDRISSLDSAVDFIFNGDQECGYVGGAQQCSLYWNKEVLDISWRYLNYKNVIKSLCVAYFYYSRYYLLNYLL